jgi:tRNA (cmo5U34)-methyltransferase
MANVAAGLSTPSAHPVTPTAHSSLGHLPQSKWQFDDDVTDVFDDMLARSIPQIDAMRDLVSRAATRFVQPGTHIVDLGCARGAAMAPLVERFHTTNRFLGIEASAPMVAACQERFRDLIDAGIVEIRESDLRFAYSEVDASVTLCVLTLMFAPIEHRFRILADVFAHTRPGGVFILVEKILGVDAMLNTLLTDLYYDHKRAMGYTDEAIDRKRLALEGVLVPVTATWNEQMLRDTGFHHVECFWRCLNFAGWVAIKA